MLTLGSDLTGPGEPGAVAGLLAAADEHDGVAAVGEAGVLAIRHGTTNVRHLWAARGEELLGYAQVDDDGSAELVVHPAHRRQGTGRRLLDAVRDATDGAAAVWSHGDLPAARALGAAAGMTVTRELWQMARDLPAPGQQGEAEAAAAATPAGVALRTFVPGADEDGWVTLNARAFADHPEQGRLTADDVRAREAEDWFDPALLWLAHRAGEPEELLASMWVKVVPGEDSGEIYALGVDPDAQGRGLGRWLTDVALAALAERGLARATLYVEGDNVPARRTYERAGFARSAVDVQYRWVAPADGATMSA